MAFPAGLGSDWVDAHTTNAIVDIRADDPEFGDRFHRRRGRGGRAAQLRTRVWRLYPDQRVWSTTTRKGREAHGERPVRAVHDDRVQRVFTAPAPDVV